MIKPYLKEKLHENLIGTHVNMTDSIVSEVISSLNFDFIWIDTEHSENSPTNIRHHLNAIQGNGVPAIVRVTKNDPNHTKHILEMGPDGIIFPMINTPEEADAAMKSCLYPPVGTRGFGPLRATRYGADDIDEYIKNSSNMCRFIQIETEEAVKNLPEIVKNPYIDGYFFGVCDLSGSVGQLNNIYGEKTQALVRETVKILKDAGKPIGLSTNCTDPEQNKYWFDLGVNIISCGGDFDYILRGAKENLRGMTALMKNGK